MESTLAMIESILKTCNNDCQKAAEIIADDQQSDFVISIFSTKKTHKK